MVPKNVESQRYMHTQSRERSNQHVNVRDGSVPLTILSLAKYFQRLETIQPCACVEKVNYDCNISSDDDTVAAVLMGRAVG
jgi:hypothetical protein